MWVVDTCVLIDLLRRDEAFATLAADALDAKRVEGLTIAPLTYVELAPALGGDVRAQDYFEASCISVGLFDPDSGVKRCEHGARSAECLQRAA